MQKLACSSQRTPFFYDGSMTDNTKPTPTLTAPAASDDETAESRMRLALGLRGAASNAGHAPQQRADQARARHKFVQDGGVPVVMLNRSHDQDAIGTIKTRVAELERHLDQERTAHAATKRLMAEVQATLQQEKTRFAHTELAHADALAVAARATEAAVTRADVAIADAAIARAEAVIPARVPAIAQSSPDPVANPDAPMKVKRGRPARKPAIDRASLERPAKAEKPVRWWTPSYRAKKA